MSKRTHSPPPYPELAKRYKHQSELESGPAGMAQPKPTFIRISDDEKCMLGLAKDELVSSLDESWLVSPTKQLSHRQPSEDPICASSLTIGVGQNTSFIQKKLKTALSENNPSFESLKNWVDTIVSESINTTTLVTPHFFQCQAKILTKLARCGSEIHNVTELRYILGDPIMEMLCTIFSLKVRLEESVSQQHEQTEAEQTAHEQVEGTHPEESSVQTPPRTTQTSRSLSSSYQTPGTSTAKSVSEGSRADYTCYTLRNDDQSIVAVIIETKLRSHSRFHHAVAQVIGYYLALRSEEETPPLVFVLSDTDIELVMFPFEELDSEIDSRSRLVNAVRFKKVPLWSSGHRTDFNMSALAIIYLVLRITVEERFKGNFVLYAYPDAIKKRSICRVTSVTDELERVKNENEELRNENEVKTQENEELKDKLREALALAAAASKK